VGADEFRLLLTDGGEGRVALAIQQFVARAFRGVGRGAVTDKQQFGRTGWPLVWLLPEYTRGGHGGRVYETPGPVISAAAG
jgi:hypothetical protein